jgi:hypothetical protein
MEGRKYRAEQIRLYLFVMDYLADKSRFMVENGGVPFDDHEWERLRYKAELPKGTAEKVRPHYVKPTAGLFPLFEQLPSGLYAVRDKNLHSFLTEQGERRAKNSQSGSESAKRRAGKKEPAK